MNVTPDDAKRSMFGDLMNGFPYAFNSGRKSSTAISGMFGRVADESGLGFEQADNQNMETEMRR